MEEKLFSVEILVKTILYYVQKVDPLPRIGSIEINVTLGNKFSTQIRRDIENDSDEEHNERNTRINDETATLVINTGKSIVFPGNKEEIVQLYKDHNYEITVVNVETKQDLGCCTLLADKDTINYVLSTESEPKVTPSANTGIGLNMELFDKSDIKPNVMDEALRLVSKSGENLGIIELYVRLTNFGPRVQTHFQIFDPATTEYQRTYYFKNSRCKEGFQIQKVGSQVQPEQLPMAPILGASELEGTQLKPMFISPFKEKASVMVSAFKMMKDEVEEEPQEDTNAPVAPVAKPPTDHLTPSKIRRMLCGSRCCPVALKFRDLGLGPFAPICAGLGAPTGRETPHTAYGTSQMYGNMDQYGPYGLLRKKPSKCLCMATSLEKLQPCGCLDKRSDLEMKPVCGYGTCPIKQISEETKLGACCLKSSKESPFFIEGFVPKKQLHCKNSLCEYCKNSKTILAQKDCTCLANEGRSNTLDGCGHSCCAKTKPKSGCGCQSPSRQRGGDDTKKENEKNECNCENKINITKLNDCNLIKLILKHDNILKNCKAKLIPFERISEFDENSEILDNNNKRSKLKDVRIIQAFKEKKSYDFNKNNNNRILQPLFIENSKVPSKLRKLIPAEKIDDFNKNSAKLKNIKKKKYKDSRIMQPLSIENDKITKLHKLIPADFGKISKKLPSKLNNLISLEKNNGKPTQKKNKQNKLMDGSKMQPISIENNKVPSKLHKLIPLENDDFDKDNGKSIDQNSKKNKLKDRRKWQPLSIENNNSVGNILKLIPLEDSDDLDQNIEKCIQKKNKRNKLKDACKIQSLSIEIDDDSCKLHKLIPLEKVDDFDKNKENLVSKNNKKKKIKNVRTQQLSIENDNASFIPLENDDDSCKLAKLIPLEKVDDFDKNKENLVGKNNKKKKLKNGRIQKLSIENDNDPSNLPKFIPLENDDDFNKNDDDFNKNNNEKLVENSKKKNKKKNGRIIHPLPKENEPIPSEKGDNFDKSKEILVDKNNIRNKLKDDRKTQSLTQENDKLPSKLRKILPLEKSDDKNSEILDTDTTKSKGKYRNVIKLLPQENSKFQSNKLRLRAGMDKVNNPNENVNSNQLSNECNNFHCSDSGLLAEQEDQNPNKIIKRMRKLNKDHSREHDTKFENCFLRLRAGIDIKYPNISREKSHKMLGRSSEYYYKKKCTHCNHLHVNYGSKHISPTLRTEQGKTDNNNVSSKGHRILNRRKLCTNFVNKKYSLQGYKNISTNFECRHPRSRARKDELKNNTPNPSNHNVRNRKIPYYVFSNPRFRVGLDNFCCDGVKCNIQNDKKGYKNGNCINKFVKEYVQNRKKLSTNFVDNKHNLQCSKNVSITSEFRYPRLRAGMDKLKNNTSNSDKHNFLYAKLLYTDSDSCYSRLREGMEYYCRGGKKCYIQNDKKNCQNKHCNYNIAKRYYTQNRKKSSTNFINKQHNLRCLKNVSITSDCRYPRLRAGMDKLENNTSNSDNHNFLYGQLLYTDSDSCYSLNLREDMKYFCRSGKKCYIQNDKKDCQNKHCNHNIAKRYYTQNRKKSSTNCINKQHNLRCLKNVSITSDCRYPRLRAGMDNLENDTPNSDEHNFINDKILSTDSDSGFPRLRAGMDDPCCGGKKCYVQNEKPGCQNEDCNNDPNPVPSSCGTQKCPMSQDDKSGRKPLPKKSFTFSSSRKSTDFEPFYFKPVPRVSFRKNFDRAEYICSMGQSREPCFDAPCYANPSPTEPYGGSPCCGGVEHEPMFNSQKISQSYGYPAPVKPDVPSCLGGKLPCEKPKDPCAPCGRNVKRRPSFAFNPNPNEDPSPCCFQDARPRNQPGACGMPTEPYRTNTGGPCMEDNRRRSSNRPVPQETYMCKLHKSMEQGCGIVCGYGQYHPPGSDPCDFMPQPPGIHVVCTDQGSEQPCCGAPQPPKPCCGAPKPPQPCCGAPKPPQPCCGAPKPPQPCCGKPPPVCPPMPVFPPKPCCGQPSPPKPCPPVPKPCCADQFMKPPGPPCPGTCGYHQEHSAPSPIPDCLMDKSHPVCPPPRPMIPLCALGPLQGQRRQSRNQQQSSPCGGGGGGGGGGRHMSQSYNSPQQQRIPVHDYNQPYMKQQDASCDPDCGDEAPPPVHDYNRPYFKPDMTCDTDCGDDISPVHDYNHPYTKLTGPPCHPNCHPDVCMSGTPMPCGTCYVPPCGASGICDVHSKAGYCGMETCRMAPQVDFGTCGGDEPFFMKKVITVENCGMKTCPFYDIQELGRKFNELSALDSCGNKECPFNIGDIPLPLVDCTCPLDDKDEPNEDKPRKSSVNFDVEFSAYGRDSKTYSQSMNNYFSAEDETPVSQYPCRRETCRKMKLKTCPDCGGLSVSGATCDNPNVPFDHHAIEEEPEIDEEEERRIMESRMKSRDRQSRKSKARDAQDDKKEVNVEKVKIKKPKRKTRFSYRAGEYYPGIRVGHKACVSSNKNVPSYMGWLWNYPAQDRLKKRPGWKPGVLGKTMMERIKAHRAEHGIPDPPELKMLISKKKVYGEYAESEESEEEVEPKPTLTIKKKDGAYLITMNPLKDPKTLAERENPYMNVQPMQFIISKQKPEIPEADSLLSMECEGGSNSHMEDDGSKSGSKTGSKVSNSYKDCLCAEDQEIEVESSSSESELDIEFTPPAGLIFPEYFKKKPNVVHVDTQYNEFDLTDPDLPFILIASKSKKKKAKKV